ncbi:MAG: RluA family pseudouridine synthase [Planctomycetes bacterium]|nr:RluA family pseudouridine synthase [Planctomycetota bacterium]
MKHDRRADSGETGAEARIVDEELGGIRLQDFLERTWPQADRRALRRLVADGRVTVNRMPAELRQKLFSGDLVELALPAGQTAPPAWSPRSDGAAAGPAVERLPAVLAEADFCLVVDKPPGVPTLADRAGKSKGVHGMLCALRPGEDLRVAHRLDRDTSGCLALARDLDAARWLDLQFREGRVRKEYLALVEGVVGRDAFEVRKHLGPDRRRPGKVRVVREGTKGARSAHTEVEVLERFRAHTLLRVRPRTGRGHQIRVHLRSAGHPIVADVDYGAKGPLLLSAIKPGYKARFGTLEAPLLARMFLHASRIEIPCPPGSAIDVLAVDCPLPADLQLALDKLRHFARQRGGGEP